MGLEKIGLSLSSAQWIETNYFIPNTGEREREEGIKRMAEEEIDREGEREREEDRVRERDIFSSVTHCCYK